MARAVGVVACLPYYTEGIVVKGFGRGSASLGIPTANFDDHVVSNIPQSMGSGVYYGFANIDGGPISKMVMSVGQNPHFHNKVKTMETHILRKFDNDFYGSWMKVVVVGFIRPMQSYSSIDGLISAIHSDIEIACSQLDTPDVSRYLVDVFFLASHHAPPTPSPVDCANSKNDVKVLSNGQCGKSERHPD